MAPRRCCCKTCRLAQDDFNRADSADPGPKWKIISGEWEILANTLKGDGQLTTTRCHPSAYTKGSYIAEMTLVGMSDGTTAFWEVWIGDPASPPYRVEVSHTSATSTAILRLYDTVGLIHAETYTGVTTNETLRVCWAPTLMISAFLGNRIPHIDHCIATAGSNCYTVGSDSLGGFSFAEGRFDDWTYDVHYIDNQDCEACSCFCWKSAIDYLCLPTSLTLTFESVGADAAVMPDMTMTQSFGTPATAWPDKQGQWNSPVYNCGLPVGAEFAFRFECGRPINQMALIPLSKDYDTTLGGQIVWSWLTGSAPTNSGRFAILDPSTCNPLSIVFPEIKINSADPGPACGMGGGFQPYCSDLSGTCFATEPDIRFIPRIIV